MDNKEMKKELERTRVALQSFSSWVEQKVVPIAEGRYPADLTAWRKELAEIRALVEGTDHPRVALIGTTGSGKSTFLNAILHQIVLPVSVMEPCTAFVTSVGYSPGPDYEVRVNFITEREWKAELKNLIAAFGDGDEDPEGEGRTESRRILEAARKRIEAVYGDLSGRAPTDALLTKPLPAEVKRIFQDGAIETKRFVDPKEMLSYLKKLIRGTSTLWPLVKQVTIRGPYECLAGGVELVDLPGLNDPNEARVEVTREFLRTSPLVWVVFSMVRGLTEDIQRILREEKLLRTLVFSCTYGGLTLIGTKADEIDNNAAEELGLPEDCRQIELVRVYREKTIAAARDQLVQMVRDFRSDREDEDTLQRMLEMARKVRVHATSANAYIKLRGFGSLRKDYGIDDVSETGILDVHTDLVEIGTNFGAGHKSKMALVRLEYLRREIEYFFRAKGNAPSREMERAREMFQKELDSFRGEVRRMHEQANARLKTYREKFLERLDPIFNESVRDVSRSIEGWRIVHWATLRAIVQRDGFFKSPSTGKSYDFNADLAEPLLAQLPIFWERYFTDDLGRVVDEFIVRVGEAGGGFCEKVRLIMRLLFQQEDEQVGEQLDWFREKVSFLAREAQASVLATVKGRRAELAQKMPLVAKDQMDPAYETSRAESGSGMKKRILLHLEPTALHAAGPIFTTIQADLLEGLKDLELVITGMLLKLTESAVRQADTVVHNANIDVTEAGIDPSIAEILSTMPKIDKEEPVYA